MTSVEPVVPRLRVAGLCKRYGAVQALDRVDFEVLPGETMALLGENGAGKSTLVKVLSGLVTPDEGHIEIDGRPVTLRNSQQSQAAGIAVVQQEYSSVPNLTVAENVFLGQADSPLVWRKRALAKAAAPLLASVGLDYLDPLIGLQRLSVAERQLVEIARVLARDAKVLLFDEPTAALSDTEIARVLAVVRSLAAQGRSVIYVTHRLREVYEVADRVTVFRDGCNLAPRHASEVDVDEIVTMMLGRRLSQLFPQRPPLTGEPLLNVDGLDVPGLDGPVSFTVRAGEILGLTGQ
ncbi:MAG TPA: ATP-binding cassette domain-containing protein, partial [Ilumatobacteraceae bacterium]